MKLTPLLAGVLFGLAGFAGNWFKFELFFGVDFLFGSFFVMLALLRFGAVAGIIAGVIASLTTFFLWNHPWAVVIFSAEIFTVAYLHNRRGLDLSTSIILYWLIPGSLLAWYFYHELMHVPTDSTILVVLKQAINASLNALFAKFFYLMANIIRPIESRKPRYREYVSTGILTIILCPALLYITFDLREHLAEQLDDAHRRASHTADLTRSVADSWVSEKHQIIKALAAVIVDPEQQPLADMQRQAEIFLASSVGLKRIGVMNRDAVSIAYTPLVDELGKSSIGLNFADRPYLPILRERHEPFVGDLHMGREGKPAPAIPLLAPIPAAGDFKGYCAGILDLGPLQELLIEIIGPRNLVITLLDRNGLIIASTNQARKMMTPLPRASGETRRISAKVFHWLPAPEKGISIMQRWRKSYYFAELKVSPAIGWTVRVEAPLLPALTSITQSATNYFSAMVGLLLLTSGVEFLFSRWQSRPIIALQALTEQVASHPESPVDGIWPSSPIYEIDALSRNFRKMADSLRHTIAILFTLNRELENLVTLRTSEFRNSEERLRIALHAARQGWFDLDVQTGAAEVSPDIEEMLGYEPGEFVATFENWVENVHPEDRPVLLAAYRNSLERGEAVTIEYRRRTKKGAWLWLSSTGRIVAYDSAYKPLRMIGIHADITERKKTEDRLRESEERFRSLFEKVQVVALVIDPTDGSIVDANAAAAAFYGWNYNQLSAMNIADINMLSPSEVKKEMEEARTEKRTNFLFKHRRADGAVRDVEVYSGPIQSAGKTVLYSIIHDVTEKKRIEAQLSESEELFSLLMRYTPVYTFIKSIEEGKSRVLSVSDNFENMLGIPAASMIGRTMEELFPAEFARKIADDDLAVVASGENTELDETLNDRHYTTIKFPIVRKDGSSLLAGFTIDITERKQAEEKLRESENLFRSIFEQAAVGVALIDSNTGGFIQVNKRYCDIVGQDAGELLTMDFQNITHPDDLPKNLENMARLRQGEIPLFTMEKRYIRKDGGITWANLSVSPLWLPGEAPTRHIAMIQDITAFKKAAEALWRSEQRFRTLITEMTNGFALHEIILDAEGRPGDYRYLEVNRAFEQMIGLAAESTIGRTVLELLPETEPYWIESYGKVALTGQAARFENYSQALNRFFEVLAYSPQQGQFAVVFTDITERKAAEQELQELNRTLEARVEAETKARVEKERMLVQQSKMAAMGEMIGAIAHQWRQPLNAVAIIVQDIRDAFATGKLDREYMQQGMESAMAQIRFMSKTIDDFRNFFIPDKVRIRFDAKKAMAEVIAIMAGQCQSHNICCSITCLVHGKTIKPGDPIEPCDEMWINGFENEMKQVFLNLIDNAKDAILERRRVSGAQQKGIIRVEFDRDGERVVIRVMDNGGGMPDAAVDRIFEPYFTSKEQGKGTGIGLYMAKTIIENNMGGRIMARNTDEGAEFTIVI